MTASVDDYKTSILSNQCIKDPVLKGGNALLISSGFPWMEVGGFCVVFKYNLSNGHNYAVRCWHSELRGIKERTAAISEVIKKSGLRYFVDFEYVDSAIITPSGIQPIVRMEWISALNLKEYIIQNKSTPNKIKQLAKNFYDMCCDLHKAQISHGDLQHENIKVLDNGELCLLDYDSIYNPAMGQLADYIHGKLDYQHPLRKTSSLATINIDAFSELVIYTALIYLSDNPDAIDDTMKISDWLIFKSDDYDNFTSSPIYKDLKKHSQETKFLVESMADNLKKKNIDDLDNIEVIAEVGKQNGINIFEITRAQTATHKSTINTTNTKNTKSKTKSLSIGNILPWVLAIIGALVGWYLAGKLNDDSPSSREEVVIEQPKEEAPNPPQETVVINEPTKPIPEVEQPKQLTPQPPVPPKPVVTSGTLNLSGGTYVGSIKDGKADGKGKMTYSSRTLISKYDSKKRYAEAGQYIDGTWKNGELNVGNLFNSDGSKVGLIMIGARD